MYDSEYVKDILFICGRQLGKCQGVDTEVLTTNGRLVRLGDIQVGDTVLAKDDNFKFVPRKVTDKFDQGRKKLICIKTRMGAEIEVTREHRLLTATGFRCAGTFHVGTRIGTPRKCGEFTGVVTPPRDRVALTAYAVGDGCCSQPGAIGITTAASEVKSALAELLVDHYGVSPDKRTKDCVSVNVHRAHPLHSWLEEDGLVGHYSWEKFIPDWVFGLSREDTTLFVESLWATDGSIKAYKGFPSITYCSTSRAIVDSLRSLLLKFGIVSSVRTKGTGYTKDDEWHVCRQAYELRVEGYDSQVRFVETFQVPGKPAPTFKTFKACRRNSNRDTLPRATQELFNKLLKPILHNRGDSLRTAGLRLTLRYPPSIDKARKYLEFAAAHGLSDTQEYRDLSLMVLGDVAWDEVVAIEDAGEHQTYDLEIEGDHNYVADFIVSHNSINLSRSEVLDLISIPQLQILYVAPLQQQTQRYSTLYLLEAIQSCALARQLQSPELDGVLSDSKILKSVGHQSFATGAGIQLTYAKTSSDRARGIFADRIDFDEIQDQLTDNIPVISESLTASEWGVRRFTGTAKTADNTIESLWQKSAKCEWAIPCSGCNTWAIPNEDGRVLDMIQADGIHCVHCGKKLNPRDGQWVPAYPSRMNEFRGYHIPQIVVPAIVESKEKWRNIIQKVMNLPLPLLMQEVLGISYSVGARIITQADIDRQSVLPPIAELQKKLRDYTLTVSGVDWGGAEQSSFTVHTIIGIRPDGRIDTLWSRRYVGFDPDEMLAQIAKAHRWYKCAMMAADYGMGFDKNVMLEKRFNIIVIQIFLCRQNRLLAYSPTLGQHRWTVDKTTAMEVMFLAIKYGRIFFPPQDEFEIYTRDLLSPYEQVTESGGLAHRMFVRNPSQPDDFAMSLCFACMLAMQMVNSSMMDLIPASAFGGGQTGSGAPAIVNVDPADVLAALSVG